MNIVKTHPDKVIASLDKARFILHEGEISPDKVSSAKESYNGFFIYYPYTTFWYKKTKENHLIFSVNPSDFSCYTEYFSFISEHFVKPPYDAKVTALDCAITFPEDYSTFMRTLTFGKKRKVKAYFASRKSEGIHIGSKGRKFELTIYDKRKLNNLKYPCTRIEINSFPKGLTLGTLFTVQWHSPFNFVKRNSFSYTAPDKKGSKEFLRFQKLMNITELVGPHFAKQRLNTTRNYTKQFSKFILAEEVKPSLDNIFQEGIENYFEKKG